MMTEKENPRQYDEGTSTMENEYLFDDKDSKTSENEQVSEKKFDLFDELIALAEINPIFSGKFKDDELTVVVCRLIRDLCAQNHLHLAATDSGLLQYNGRYWEKLNERTLKHQLSKLLRKMGVDGVKAEHFKFLKDVVAQLDSTMYAEWHPRDLQSVKINLHNGSLDIDSMELLPHDPNDCFRYCLPYDYDPIAECPMFLRFLSEVLPEDEVRRAIQEFFGYVLLRNLRWEKALFLYGNGANGKSVTLDVMSAAIGEANCSSVPFPLLCKENSPHLQELEGKLLNKSNDISASIENSGIAKLLISGEPISTRRLYENPRVMTDYARLAFACNELPQTTDFSHGFFRRLLIIPFTIEIPPERQDKGLADRIIKSELPGVLNWFIGGAKRLLANGHFTESPSINRQLLAYRQSVDNVSYFIEEKGIMPGREKQMLLAPMYQAYLDFCRESGFKACSKSKFSNRLRGLKINVERGTHNKVTCYFNTVTPQNDVNVLSDNDLPF